MFFSAPAVAGFVATLYTCGLSLLITEPPGEVTCLISVGRMITPLFAIAEATIAICIGVVSIFSWPNARRPGSTLEKPLSVVGSNSFPFAYRPEGDRASDGVSSGGVE